MTTNIRALLKRLETLAAQAGVPVRYEGFRMPKGTQASGRGGLVRLGPTRFILCEQHLPAIDKLAVIAEALATVGVDVLDLPPILRARIHGTPARPTPRPRLTLKPLAKVKAATG